MIDPCGSIVERLGPQGVRRVFVHDSTAWWNSIDLAPMVPLKRLYAERALLLARPADVVCLAHRPDPDFLDYLASHGIGPRRENVVVASDGCGAGAVRALRRDACALARVAALLEGESVVSLDPFVAGPEEAELARSLASRLGGRVELRQGPARAAEHANQKHLVREVARELGLPLADGEIVELEPGADGLPRNLPDLAAAIARRLSATGSAIVRGSAGVSGAATTVVGRKGIDPEAALRAIGARRDNRFYLVDSMVDWTVSPNVQLSIEPDGVGCAGVADQVLDASLGFLGNAAPSAARTIDAMIGAAERLGGWLRRQGYTGLVGLDFCEAIDPAGGSPRPLFAELNARINGSTYALALAARLRDRQLRVGDPAPAAFDVARTPSRCRSFAELSARLGELRFDRATGAGVFAYNVGCLALGVFECAAFADSPASARALRKAAAERVR